MTITTGFLCAVFVILLIVAVGEIGGWQFHLTRFLWRVARKPRKGTSALKCTCEYPGCPSCPKCAFCIERNRTGAP